MPRKANPLPPVDDLRTLFEVTPEGRLINRISRTSRRAGNYADTSFRRGYRTVYACGALHNAHRIVWALANNADPVNLVDHINGDTLDNRRENLRVATNSENKCNSRSYKNNTSGYKGVHLRKDNGKWRASIGFAGSRKNLGEYETAGEAAAVVAAARQKTHGEFARTA